MGRSFRGSAPEDDDNVKKKSVYFGPFATKDSEMSSCQPKVFTWEDCVHFLSILISYLMMGESCQDFQWVDSHWHGIYQGEKVKGTENIELGITIQ